MSSYRVDRSCPLTSLAGPTADNSSNVRVAVLEPWRSLAALDGIPEIADRGEKLIGKGQHGWQYFEGGSSPGDAWTTPVFNDSTLKTGTAPLGYGDDDLKTTIGFGGDAKAKNSVAFFRKKFALSDANASSRYAAGIRYDDGAVVYLNGVEVFRYNVDKAKPGEPNEKQFASSTIGGNDRRERHYWFLRSIRKMRQGENVIAVSVHQHEWQ